MTKPPSRYTGIPAGHPFSDFLLSLPRDDTCDARPDFIEIANRNRLMVAFTGVNSSARLRRFIYEFRKLDNHNAKIVHQNIKADSALCIVYIFEQRTSPNGEIIKFPLPMSIADIAERASVSATPLRLTTVSDAEEENEPEPTNNPMPGVKLMPSY